MTPTFVPLAGKNAAVTLEEIIPQVLAAPPQQSHYPVKNNSVGI